MKSVDQAVKSVREACHPELAFDQHYALIDHEDIDVIVSALDDDLASFMKWADKSKALTWAGKLGLKERWLNRNNPEYQAMLKARGEK